MYWEQERHFNVKVKGYFWVKVLGAYDVMLFSQVLDKN